KNNAPATRAWLMNIFRQERLRMLNFFTDGHRVILLRKWVIDEALKIRIFGDLFKPFQRLLSPRCPFMIRETKASQTELTWAPCFRSFNYFLHSTIELSSGIGNWIIFI